MTWSTPESYLSVFQHLFRNYENGYDLSEALFEFSERQKSAMIDDNLDAYTCGIDNIMELGYSQNIIAQPTRLSFREMLEVDSTEISTIRDALTSYISDIKNIDFPVAIDAWQEEIINGVQMDIHRAQFMEYLLTAMLNHRESNDLGASDYLSMAADELQQGQRLMDTMRTRTWDPKGERLFAEGTNSTIYQFGYLHRASDLCYWQREHIQATNAIVGANDAPPGCGL